jgi:hypothetical protein
MNIKFYLLAGVVKHKSNFALEQLIAHGVPPTNIIVVSEPNFEAVEHSQYLQHLCPGLNSRQASVTIKHALALKSISTSEDAFGVILEDNVLFLANPISRVQQYISLKETQPWDILFDSNIIDAERAGYVSRSSNLKLYPKSLLPDGKTEGGSKGANFVLVERKTAQALDPIFLPSKAVSDCRYNEVLRELNLVSVWAEPPNVHKIQSWGSTVTSFKSTF